GGIEPSRGERDMDAQGQLAPGNGSESRSRACRHRAQSDNREYVSTRQPSIVSEQIRICIAVRRSHYMLSYPELQSSPHFRQHTPPILNCGNVMLCKPSHYRLDDGEWCED